MDVFIWLATVLAGLGALGSLVLYVRCGTDRQSSIAAKTIRMGGATFIGMFSLLFGVLAWTGWNWELALCFGGVVLFGTTFTSIANYLRLGMLGAKGRRVRRLLKENPRSRKSCDGAGSIYLN